MTGFRSGADVRCETKAPKVPHPRRLPHSISFGGEVELRTPHDTPPYLLMPSSTSAHSSDAVRAAAREEAAGESIPSPRRFQVFTGPTPGRSAYDSPVPSKNSTNAFLTEGSAAISFHAFIPTSSSYSSSFEGPF